MALAVSLMALPAHATKACVQNAKSDFKQCRAGCVEDFQLALDLCSNKDHACVENCRAGRKVCINLADNGLDACNQPCDDALDAARTTCKATNCGGACNTELELTAFLTCMIQPRADAAGCHATCRANHVPDLEAIRACEVGFRGCKNACPPATP